MPAQQQSMPEGNKLVSDKCKAYQKKINALLQQEFNYFSTQLPDDLSKMIDRIQRIANSNQIGVERKKSILFTEFQVMQEYIKKEINRNLELYNQPGITLQQSELLDNISKILRLDVEAALEVPRVTDSRSTGATFGQLSSTATAPKRQQPIASEELLAKISELERALGESQIRFTDLQETAGKEIERLTAELLAATDENTRLKASLQDAGKQALAAEGKVGVAEKTALEAQQRARELQRQLDLKENQIQQASTHNQDLARQLLAAEASAADAEKRASAENARAEQADSRSLKLQQQIAKLQKELDLQKQTLLSREGGNTGLQSQIDLLKKQLQEKDISLESAKLTNQQLLSTNGTLSASNTQLLSENETLKQQLAAQSLRLASQRELEDRLGTQDRNFETLQSKLTAADARATAAEARAEAAEARAEAAGKQSTTIEQQRQEIDQLIAEVAGLKEAQIATTIEKQALSDQNTQANLELKTLLEQLAITKLEKEELEVRNGELTTSQNGLVDGLMLSNSALSQRIVKLEKKLLELQEKSQELQLSRTPPESVPVTDGSSVTHVDPAIGIEPAKDNEVANARLLPLREEKRPDSASAVLVGRLDQLADVETLGEEQAEEHATGQESGDILIHEYEVNANDRKVKKSTYHAENTKKEFDNQNVGALFQTGVITFDNEESPTEIRYTQPNDPNSILAGAVNLECISKSQPDNGTGSVQATMKDCDDHKEFVLDVLIKFHERLNAKLNGDNPETAYCTTIDYKGTDQYLLDIINLHNKAARIINAKDKTDLAIKITQAVGIIQAAEGIKKEIASPATQPKAGRRERRASI